MEGLQVFKKLLHRKGSQSKPTQIPRTNAVLFTELNVKQTNKRIYKQNPQIRIMYTLINNFIS